MKTQRKSRRHGWRRRSDRFFLGLGIIATLALFATYNHACNSKSGGVSGPDPLADANTPTPGVAAGPASPLDPAQVELAIKITNTGNVLNSTAITYTACLFDAPYGAGQLVDEWKAKPGKTRTGFEIEGCDKIVGQIDVIPGDKCPTNPHGLVPLAANPNVTIQADGIDWQLLPHPVWENVSEWSECREPDLQESTRDEPQCSPETREGVKTKTFDLVWYEANQCSEDRREVRRISKVKTKKCSFETGEKVCPVEITHTQRPRYCRDEFNWDTWQWEQVCYNHYKLFSSKKWQCQAVPPGVPGHYPNHFDAGQHDDFFGAPDEDHCYNVVN